MASPSSAAAYKFMVYQYIQLVTTSLYKHLPPSPIVLDLGGGDGFISTLIARDLSAHRLVIIDHHPLGRGLPLPKSVIRRHTMDIESDELVVHYRHYADAVLSIRTLSGLKRPRRTVFNMLRLLRPGDYLVVMDKTETGWAQERIATARAGAEEADRYRHDIERAIANGLANDKRIREFWEEGIFPRLPGEHAIGFNGSFYAAVFGAHESVSPELIPDFSRGDR